MSVFSKRILIRSLFICANFNGLFSEIYNLFQRTRIRTFVKPEKQKKKLFNNKTKPKTLLWLDDRLNPLDKRMDWLSYSPIGRNVDAVWVKNKFEFKNWILKNGLPDAICFDTDLGDSVNNGLACARWLVTYCKDQGLKPPTWSSQSTDPDEKAKIKRFLKQSYPLS
ncbi:cyclic-phosphate processing receiver domain-containing protein [Christiangramia portivictoriae]|uniref:cyclic-phosphate processing receiver domain-containing protein n=1 Tax=Christiangramia portivictoriae TaxID=326069 RepID=UPI0006881FFC